MAEQIKVLTLAGLQTLITQEAAKMDSKDSTTLSSAKTYADGLADNYDAAGTAATKVKELADGAVKTNADAIAVLKGADTVDGSVAKQVKTAKEALQEEIGTLSGLETTAKSNLVTAINEVRNSVSAGGTAAAITIDTSKTTTGSAKTYTIKQGDSTVGTIEIPKDMVVSSGTVETNPTGLDAGTYLVLTLANATSDKVYINVGTLVDIYTAKASATQVQLAINSSTREISAAIVAGSISTTELAANAVTTAKIADGNVTKDKLASDVQTSLGAADSAVQSVATGTTNGSLAVDGTDVAVKGLGSAAYTASTAYATADQGTKADTAVQSVATGTANGTISVDNTNVSVYGLGSAAYTASTAYDAAGTAETKVNALANGAVSTNTGNISSLASRVSALEGTTYTAITDAEITALFA